MSHADLFRRIGEGLYGPNWKRQMSLDLDISMRTIRRWSAGENPIPCDIMDELIATMGDRAMLLDELAQEAAATFN